MQPAVTPNPSPILPMPEAERRAKADKIFTSVQGLMLRAYSRWLDESEYESLDLDYKPVFDKFLEPFGASVLKMSKRPFGFHYILGGATYAVEMTQVECRFRRVK